MSKKLKLLVWKQESRFWKANWPCWIDSKAELKMESNAADDTVCAFMAWK